MVKILSTMAKMTVAAFAASLTPPVSRQRVNDFCKRGTLVREKRLIDTDHPTNAKWLEERKTAPDPPKPPGRWLTPTTDEEELTDALSVLLATQDIRTLDHGTVQKVQRIESALKTRVDRQNKRGELIDRSLVQMVLGKIYQVDVQQFRMLGAKLSPDLCGLMGVDDPVIQLMVEQRIEGEILKSLEHIKRIINEFLTMCKVGGIE